MKLSIKLVVLIIVLAIVSSALVALSSYHSIQRQVQERSLASMYSLASTVEALMRHDSHADSPEVAKAAVMAMQESAAVSCARIVFAQIDVRSSDFCQGSADLEHIFDLAVNESAAVYLQVYKDSSYVQEMVREQFMGELYTLAKIILAMCASILVATYMLITKPIQGVSRALENVTFDRDISMLKEGGRKDEIGKIGRAINLMLVKAKKQIITEKMLAAKSSELSNQFKLIFQLSKNSLAVTDKDLNIKSFNPKFLEMVQEAGGSEESLQCSNWLEWFTDDPNALKTMVGDVEDTEKPITTELEIRYKHGEKYGHRFYHLTFVKNISEDMGVTVLFFIYDMTEHLQKLHETEYEASHDNLTGLYNRRAATQKIEFFLSTLAEHEQLAVLFIDLDGFKEVNDKYGHEVGDVVVAEMGRRLRMAIRKTDIACRWGGDEFLVVLTDISLSQATTTANKILKSICEPVLVPHVDGACSVGASIGVTLSTATEKHFPTLYDRADKAMYRVKKSGKNAVLVHGA